MSPLLATKGGDFRLPTITPLIVADKYSFTCSTFSRQQSVLSKVPPSALHGHTTETSKLRPVPLAVSLIDILGSKFRIALPKSSKCSLLDKNTDLDVELRFGRRIKHRRLLLDQGAVSMKIMPIVCVAIFPMLVTGCGTLSSKEETASGPEATVDWQKRAEAAWSSMADGDGADKLNSDHLNRALVQNGMSTDHSITFIVYPQKEDSDYASKDLAVSVRTSNTDSKPIADPDTHIVHVGRALRVTVGKLYAATDYTVNVELKGREIGSLRTQTAPKDSSSTTASIILLSCNEPWSRYDKKHNYPRVAPSTANALRLLDLRASGKLPVVIDGKPSERPSFLLGLGDQVYVDAEPKNDASLALFGGDRSNKLRIRVDGHEDWNSVLETIYRMHLLVPTFDRALKSLPTAMVWDDHEIRDGWGSQGDEAGEIPNTHDTPKKPGLKWMEYFAEARKKAWEFEVSRNPNAGAEQIHRIDVNAYPKNKREMDTAFDWGPRIKVFMMDTRTARETTEASIKSWSPAEQPLVSGKQFARLDDWLKKCGGEPSVFVLGVPVPLTMDRESSWTSRGLALLERLGVYRGELSDDIIDGWVWRGHTDARKRLISAIKTHAKSCPKDRIVVVSGDVHESGLHALVEKDIGVYAYEIISSGVGTLIGKLTRIGKHKLINKAQISTVGTTIDKEVIQVGRIAGGASFAELFVDLDSDSPPKLRVLFYSTTGASDNQVLKSTLVNAAPWVERQRVWSTGGTSVKDLFNGNRNRFVTAGNFAIQLDYDGISPPKDHKGKGTNYGLTSAAMRCEVPNSNVFNTYATNWVTIMDKNKDTDKLGHCW